MSLRTWTPEMLQRIRRDYSRCKNPHALAAKLGVTYSALQSKAKQLRIFRRKPWTQEQRDTLVRLYPTHAAEEIAGIIGRSVKSVEQMIYATHLRKKKRIRTDEGFLQRLKEMHTRGLSDAEIAEVLGCDRHTIGNHRARLGLPVNAFNERHRKRLEPTFLKGGKTRSKAHREYARRHGWPEETPVRAVQILDTLARTGVPMTRRQLAQALGLPFKSRKTFNNNHVKGNSLLAYLADKGLVIRLIRANRVTGQGKGRTCDLYALGPVALELLLKRAKEKEHVAGTTEQGQPQSLSEGCRGAGPTRGPCRGRQAKPATDPVPVDHKR